MPDRFGTVREAVEEQRKLVVDLTNLQRATRRQRIYNWLLGIVIILLLAGGGLLGHLVIENRQARVELCRSQNTAQRAGRDDLDRVLTLTSSASPEAQAFVEQVRESLSTPEQVDEDCNHSGGLDPGDYNRIIERRQ